MKPDAYFICTTPRTGSTFLCSLLKSTQIAGNPESYFRSQDKNKWADQWGVLDHIQNNFDFEEYLNACLNAGRTQNNLFACRLMWGTMDELISDIYSFSKNSLRSHKRTLDQVFGNTQFIYLKRNDYIAQAVSRLRAEQTDIWHVKAAEQTPNNNENLKYDALKIREFMREAKSHNQAWEEWFERNDINPHILVYEDLISSPDRHIKDILKFLDISIKDNISIKSENKKMSDDLSLKWIEKFKSEEL